MTEPKVRGQTPILTSPWRSKVAGPDRGLVLVGALDGLVVLDLATFIAARCAPRSGEFGRGHQGRAAWVGDDLRRLGRQADGVSLWWLSDARNKKSITCNLREPEGQALIRRLCRVDVVARRTSARHRSAGGSGTRLCGRRTPGS